MAELVVLPDLEALTAAAAERWAKLATEAVAERGRFDVALSGGSTPRPLYERLAASPYRESLPWQQTCVFWSDERRVPPGHPDSNYRMAHEALLAHVALPPGNVFRMDGEGLAGSAARAYSTALERHFGLGRREWPRFDLMLLGLGSDAHTASIFPGTRAVSEGSSMTLVYTVPKLSAERITLTLPVINASRHVVFLVSGGDKAGALATVLEGRYAPSTYPAQAVRPADGTLTWLVDAAAAAGLGARSG